jgi:hypothetical protein
LVYVRLHGADSLQWQVEVGFNRWNVYRGDLAVLTAGGDYTQQPESNPLADRACRLNQTSLADLGSPESNQVAFYLVVGVSGTSEGGLGEDSDGNPRPNAFPCSP